MSTTVKKQLKGHLDEAEAWERMRTPIPGLFIVKAPATKHVPAQLFLELNPDGKWKGFFFNTKALLTEVVVIITDDRTNTLINEIEAINPETNRHKPKELEF